ncbi:MAG: hypothetical protein V3S51_02300 [Dehalococcoidia bacterium]
MARMILRLRSFEKNRVARDAILSTLIRYPMQGVAYLCLMSTGPISATDLTESLGLSDARITQTFDKAVGELAHRGFIKEAEEA